MKRHIIFFLLFLIAHSVVGQSLSFRDHLRHGNRIYRSAADGDSVPFSKSATEYLKAIEKNPDDARAYFNLGDALLMQNQVDSAYKYFEQAAKLEKNPVRQYQAYHNMGVIRQAQQKFPEAIACYKKALRLNPKDNETRYNLCLCQHQLPKSDDQSSSDNGEGDDQNQDQKDEQKQQQPQQKQEQKKDDQQQQQKQQPKMDEETADRLLRDAQNKEKRTQQQMPKEYDQGQRRRPQKNW